MADALMVTSSFLPGRGGIESYLSELCTELAPRLAVFAPGQRDGKSIPELPYPTFGYPGSLLIPSKKVVRAIDSVARGLGTKKILFGTPWPLALLGPRLASLGYSYSVIVHGAELIAPGAVPVLSSKVAKAIAGADVVMPVSDFTAGKIRSLLDRKALAVPKMENLRARVDLERFHPDVDVSGLRDELGLQDGERMLLCFGRLVPRKGVGRLIEAGAALSDRGHKIRVVIAGAGPEEPKLRRLTNKLGAPVMFAGRVPEAEAPAYYALADVFVLPVRDRWFGLDVEGLGVVLLEAHACGTPCVTGRSGGTPEAVLDGVTGFVVDARSPTFVDRIEQLLTQPDLAGRMGRAGREHVASDFSKGIPPTPLLQWLGET